MTYLLGARDIRPHHCGSISTNTSGDSESEGEVETCQQRCPIYEMSSWRHFIDKDIVEKVGRITTSFEVGEKQGNIN